MALVSFFPILNILGTNAREMLLQTGSTLDLGYFSVDIERVEFSVS